MICGQRPSFPDVEYVSYINNNTFIYFLLNPQAWDLAVDLALAQLPAVLEDETKFQHSPFFEEQLTAFQVWLDLGSDQRNPPEQLPIVLQVSEVVIGTLDDN